MRSADVQRLTDGEAAQGNVQQGQTQSQQEQAQDGNGAMFSRSGIAFSEEMTASYAGQTNYVLTAKSANGAAGVLEYVVYEGTPSISMVSVSAGNRRQGIGRALVQELQSKFAGTGEHEFYTISEWRAVGTETLTNGYWDWVMSCIKKDDDAY